MPNTLDIPVPGDGTTPKEKVAMPIDETINLVLGQTFAKSHQVGLQAADRASAGNDNVAEQTRLGYLIGMKEVGTREAAAMQRMDTDKLSEKILDARAAAGQPNAAPAPQQVPK